MAGRCGQKQLLHFMLMYVIPPPPSWGGVWEGLTDLLSWELQMMSKTEEESSEDVFPGVTRSDSAGSDSSSRTPVVARSKSVGATAGSDSGSKVGQSVSGAHVESVGPGGGGDVDGSELESAESSAVSLSDGAALQVSLHPEDGEGGLRLAATPTLSPPGRSSPASSLTRHLSTDTPPSPLFQPKNPFLDLGGKMTKFKWSPSHINLLEELLISISGSIDKWKRFRVHIKLVTG